MGMIEFIVALSVRFMTTVHSYENGGVLDSLRKENAYGIIEAAKLFYIESMATGKILSPLENYDVTELNLGGIMPIKGSYFFTEEGEVLLKDVVFDTYVCSGSKEEMICK